MAGNEFFSPWEGDVVSSWDDMQSAIIDIKKKSNGHTLVWRGHAVAGWELHSSLYRYLIEKRPEEGVGEENLLKFEEEIVGYIRDNWRVGDVTYLELLAQLQHYGAPTRLIDVSLTPYVAIWMAVERQSSESGRDSEDARLFAFDVVRDEGVPSIPLQRYDCPWDFRSASDGGVDGETWNKGNWTSEFWFWQPPAYNERIPAQYAGFLVGGVPSFSKPGSNARYRKRPGTNPGCWLENEVRGHTSINLRMVDRKRNSRKDTKPAFTVRIASKAKDEIRDVLEGTFNFKSSTMYPDTPGRASEIKKAIDYGYFNLEAYAKD